MQAIAIAIRSSFAIAIAGGIARLARPLSVVWLARSEGAETAAATVVAWNVIELTAGAARIGIHRALQRDPTTPERAIASLMIVAAAGIAAGIGAALWLDDIHAIGVTAILAIASSMLFFATGARQTLERVAGSAALSLGLAAGAFVSHGDPTLGAIALAAVAIIATSRSIGWRVLARAASSSRLPVTSILRTALPLGIGDLLQLAIAHGDVIAVQVLTGSPVAVAGYAIARGLVDVFAPVRELVDQVITPIIDRRNAAAVASVAARWTIAIAAPIAVVVAIASPLAGQPGPIAGLVVILVVGRFAEIATSPWPLALAIVGAPSQSIIAPTVGVVAMTAGCVALGGVVGIAIAVGLGLVITNVVARHLLEDA